MVNFAIFMFYNILFSDKGAANLRLPQELGIEDNFTLFAKYNSLRLLHEPIASGNFLMLFEDSVSTSISVE